MAFSLEANVYLADLRDLARRRPTTSATTTGSSRHMAGLAEIGEGVYLGDTDFRAARTAS